MDDCIHTAFFRRHVKSTTDTSGTGTRKAIPVSFPFKSGITLPTAFAAPVDAGMIFWNAPLPSRQFYTQNKESAELIYHHHQSHKNHNNQC